jgi:glycosyltransferase involved in cell wall biosynthesis
MTSERILYMNHDNPNPSGGVKVIYDHVGHLVRNGYNAFVVHQNAGFRPDWFQENLPVLYCNQQFIPRPDDLVIIPEDHAVYFELFRSIPVRKLVFCQNHFYAFEGVSSCACWSSFGISGVIACSEPVADFIGTFLDIADLRTVHNAVSTIFAKSAPKKIQIAYMPRKRPLEANFIKCLCQRILGADDVEWVAISGMHQDDVAKTLQESGIFLSLSRHEGFGLPPLEAMAAGCLVTGFTGFGGEEYATPDNGIWCQEDDLIGCAHALVKAVRMFQCDAPELDRMVANARTTAMRYSSKRQEQELLEAIKHFLSV